MANLKTLKTRIKSVRSTQKMTKAMKMVAASRLKKAKNAVEHSRPYANKIREMLVDLAGNIANRNNFDEKFPLLTGKAIDHSKTHLLLVVSSDRGLCGGLNSSTVKYTKNRITQIISQGHLVKIYCVGKKAYEQLKTAFSDKIIQREFGIFKSNITVENAQHITNKLIDLYNQNQFDVCEVIFSKFKSAISQEQISKQLIPAQISYEYNQEKQESPIVYEPSQEEILEELLIKNITVQLYNLLLENNASEHGARMAAMESATNNAGKMIKNLTLVYNRTRQANITKELIDIISGANTV
ncbi:ATP synthase gamma chain [Alphaproteobacteria bacterium]|nr:ATP synthase gamma chain [Alphaproteobacteria bacterium]